MLLLIEPLIDQGLIDNLLGIGYSTLIVGVILASGLLIGRIAGIAVGRIVARIGADSVFRKTALGRVLLRSGFTASDLSKSLSKWIIYVASILIALQTLRIPAISEPIQSFLLFLPTLIEAFLILIFGFMLSDWVAELIKKGAAEEQRQTFYLDVIGDLTKVALYFITITLTLSQLKIDVTILHIFAQAFAWSVAIFVGVAAGIVVGWLLKDKIKDLVPP
ncbi:MAG: hypothetical protein HYY67_03170 [Thaumarchaeota archaeon]|nr:hypothetical protein [Nitrososphaerota archaeon]